ncbi:MAG: hypothetical protein IT207_05965 [Fimbriimonadaceae bacterium]|nr:hypothetical protein [Fimbriimonadaceae bacterium]
MPTAILGSGDERDLCVLEYRVSRLGLDEGDRLVLERVLTPSYVVRASARNRD